MPDTFGHRLTALRETAGLTIYALAKLAGVSNGYVAAYERGQKSPSAETVALLCQALGVSMGAFDGVTWPTNRRKRSATA